MNAASDTIVIGGGVMGLAIAVELKLRGATVTVLSRDYHQAAAHAAAGMIAPQAEGIPPSPMLDLCLESRALYPAWIRKLEELTGVDTGYWTSGILAPVYELPSWENREQVSREEKSRGAGEQSGRGEANAHETISPLHLRTSAPLQSPPANSYSTQNSDATWLDKEAIQLYQPGLGAEVVGGWWYPEDAQVDNRALMKALRQAAQSLGVDLREGVSVEAIQRQNCSVVSLRTSAGEFRANQYVLASGAYARELLPLPVRPLKGQMMSVRMTHAHHQPLPIQQVLFGTDNYLVPRRDGRLIIGATVEEVGWTPHNTPAGTRTLIERATRIYPEIQHWSIEELWWGFRPTTPDLLPILGSSSCENLVLATGHHRNGILLAPITASILADLILQQKSHPLLGHFRYDRFYSGVTGNSHSTKRYTCEGNNGQKLMVTSHSPQPTTEWNSTANRKSDNELTIAGRTFQSRLMTGTGKYADMEVMRQSLAASGSEIVTVAVRRVQTQAPGHEGLAEALDWTKLWMLPNTAGCKTAEEAVRVANFGREMAKIVGQEDNNFVKLEVVPDTKYLLPDPVGTLQAAEQLVNKGFAVLPYINADPVLAKQLEEVGCSTVMPLGSPIGSGQGVKCAANIQIIIEQANVPVVVDAGIGTPSEADYSMELGADAVLVNSAIAHAEDPIAMGRAMGLATEAGRFAYLAGRIPIKSYASASSPLTGTVS
ncbi:MAG: glycine oxidase ThiO [Cyanobacteria bacterium QH_9_48_43]|nr:MAG: glycine oxidase ThiO [Cyanobacteria bacterium QH_9_48_43]PSP04325.1 MAG: glycine oxidase ThiO [Cyanobacteria bacterium SW_12_48_29]